ncbi:MAG TPA: hypothetical protein VK524_23585, partial [Polyangiaceae bacterium]|nr:hypothetical protein [Polyangiaceae bacterium]
MRSHSLANLSVVRPTTDAIASLPIVRRQAASAVPEPLAAALQRGQALERESKRDEARQLYERVLHEGIAKTSVQAAQLLRWIARTFLQDGEYETAADCARAALAVAEQSGDEGARGHAINILAIVEWKQGNLDEAKHLYLLARESAHRSGEARLAVMTATNLGVIANVRGDEREASEYYDLSLSDARTAGLADEVIGTLVNLGLLSMQSNRLAVADRHLSEARELANVIGDRSMLITVELHLAKLRIRQGDSKGARTACDQARAIV